MTRPPWTVWLLPLSCIIVAVLLCRALLAVAGEEPKPALVRLVLEQAGPSVTVAGRPVDSEALKAFYAQRQDRPVWIKDGALSPRAQALLDTLAEAGRDGLYAADYELAPSLRTARTAQDLATADVMLSAALVRYTIDLRSGRAVLMQSDREQFLPPKPVDAVAVLNSAAAAPDIARYLASLAPSNPIYRGLRQALARYRTIAAKGGWLAIPDGPPISLDSIDPAVAVLRTRLQISGDLPSDAPVQAPDRFDEPLREAVMRFQARNGLALDGNVGPQTRKILNVPVDGRIQQILANLERARWLPEDLGDPYVIVNMAAFQLEVVEAGRVALEMRVVVGRPARSTPMFSDEITYLEFNPYWHIPPTILAEDKLPILRRDPALLTAEGIRVIAPGGVIIDPTTINWSEVSAKNFPYSLRQDPGASNALGRVKFMFPNSHDIYLHDTPSRGQFKRSTRAFSSGCIRVEKPVALAEILLKHNEGWNWARIERVIARGRNRAVVLEQPVPVHLVYLTAWMGRDGDVHFRDDLYSRDVQLVAALDAPREPMLMQLGLPAIRPLKR